jgi:hypothetical protein
MTSRPSARPSGRSSGFKFPSVSKGFDGSDSSDSSLVLLLRKLDHQRASRHKGHTRHGQSLRRALKLRHREHTSSSPSTTTINNHSSPSGSGAKSRSKKPHSGRRPLSPASALLENFTNSASLADFVSRSNALSEKQGVRVRYKRSTVELDADGHPRGHTQLQDYPRLFGSHRGISPSMTPRSHLGLTQSMAHVNATLRAEGSAGLQLVATARRLQGEQATDSHTHTDSGMFMTEVDYKATPHPHAHEGKLSLLRGNQHTHTHAPVAPDPSSRTRRQIQNALLALDGESPVPTPRRETAHTHSADSDVFLTDSGEERKKVEEREKDEEAQALADAAAFEAQQQQQREAQAREAAAEERQTASTTTPAPVTRAESVLFNPQEEHLHYVGDKKQLPERYVQDELERERVEQQAKEAAEQEQKRLQRAQLDKESFEIFNAATGGSSDVGRRAISSRERGDLNPSSRYHVEHFAAREQLTALLQGFVVRNVLVQKYCQDLVHQIKDTNSVLAAALADSAALPGGFALQLSNQSRLLKRNLIECFGPSPPRRALRFLKTEKEFAVYREIDKKRKEEYARQEMENQARAVKLMHAQSRLSPSRPISRVLEEPKKVVAKPFLRRKATKKVVHKKADYSRVTSSLHVAAPAAAAATVSTKTATAFTTLHAPASSSSTSSTTSSSSVAAAAGDKKPFFSIEKKAVADKKAALHAEAQSKADAAAVAKSRADAEAYEAAQKQKEKQKEKKNAHTEAVSATDAVSAAVKAAQEAQVSARRAAIAQEEQAEVEEPPKADKDDKSLMSVDEFDF